MCFIYKPKQMNARNLSIRETLHFQACMFKSLYLRRQFYIPLTQEYGNLSETIHEII